MCLTNSDIFAQFLDRGPYVLHGDVAFHRQPTPVKHVGSRVGTHACDLPRKAVKSGRARGLYRSETQMPELHHRGVDLLVDVLDAVEHVERMSPAEVRELLTEIGVVLGQLLERDVPEGRREGAVPDGDKGRSPLGSPDQ